MKYGYPQYLCITNGVSWELRCAQYYGGPLCYNLYYQLTDFRCNKETRYGGDGNLFEPTGTYGDNAGGQYVFVDLDWTGGPPNPNPDPDKNVGEPINTQNGDLSVQDRDITIPCPGVSLAFVRYYNSKSPDKSSLGAGWTHSFNWFLSNTNNYKVLHAGDGQFYSFREQGNIYTAPAGLGWKLMANTNGTYSLTLEEGIVYAFTSNGVLSSAMDAWGNGMALNYATNGLLTNVAHSVGQWLAFSYDTNSNLTNIFTSSSNLTVRFDYDSAGRITNATRSCATAGAFAEGYFYDSYSNMTQRVNAAGQTFGWGYSTSGLATSSVVAASYYPTYIDFSTATYTSHYSTVSILRGDTMLTNRYYFDTGLQMITNIVQVSGNAENRLTFSPDGDVTNEFLADGGDSWTGKIVRQFDACHNVTNQAFGYGVEPSNFWTYTWNTNWQVMTSITDPEGHKAEMEYTNASVSRIKLFYDATHSYDTLFGYTTNGLLSGMTNGNGHWVQYSYDEYGRLSQVTPQTGPAVEYQNNVLGFVEQITMPGDSGDRITTLEPNELGWVNQITYPDELEETFLYDALGNMTNHVDRAGRTTRFTYLPTRKLSSVLRPLSSGAVLTNSISYDNQFNTLKITDAKGRAVETYVLDLQDRATSVTNLEGQTMSVMYGIGDYVKKVTRFDGTVVSNFYNSDGLLSVVRYPSSTNAFSYLKNSLLTLASNSTCKVSNTWSFADRLTSVQSVVGNLSSVVSYSYFPAGQVSNVTSVAGTTAYDLDEADRVSSIQDQVSRFNLSYNANNGLLSQMTCTNTGIFVNYGYDVMDRVTNIAWMSASSNVLAGFRYLYDNAGMITNMQVSGFSSQVSAFGHDDLDRLISESRSEMSNQLSQISYTYDEVGNRLTKTKGGTTVTYTYSNGCNRLTGWTATSTNGFSDVLPSAVNGVSSETIGTNSALGQLYVSNSVSATAQTPSVSGTNFTLSSFPLSLGSQNIIAAIGDAAGNVGYATNSVTVNLVTNGAYLYNAAGCVTSIVYSGSGFTNTTALTWNGQYQLTAVKTNGVECERNGFDALGRRVWNWDGTTTNYMVYDGVHVLAEVDSTGGLRRSYVHGPGIDNWLAMTVYTGTTVKTYFYLTDHLGTVHAIADTNGAIVESYRYDAWGRVLGVYDGSGNPLTESKIGNRLLLHGREYSWKTGCYYFRSRWADPNLGRWLSPDGIGIAGGLNLWEFMGNNPVDNVDPYGEEFFFLLEQPGVIPRPFFDLMLEKPPIAPRLPPNWKPSDGIPDTFRPPTSPKGNYYDPISKESLRPDLKHPPSVPRHFDYKDPFGKWWRIFENGKRELKDILFGPPALPKRSPTYCA
jgi:RHS repeat-associated protein